LWGYYFLCPGQTDTKSTGFGDFPLTGVLVRGSEALSMLEWFPSVFCLFWNRFNGTSIGAKNVDVNFRRGEAVFELPEHIGIEKNKEAH
jgi:hypothetical protein